MERCHEQTNCLTRRRRIVPTVATTDGPPLYHIHASKVLFQIVANRQSDLCEARGILPEEQRGFRPARLVVGTLPILRRLQELGRERNIPLCVYFIGLKKAYDSVDQELLWQVFARIRLPPNMLAVIRQFHAGMRARGRTMSKARATSPWPPPSRSASRPRAWRVWRQVCGSSSRMVGWRGSIRCWPGTARLSAPV